MNVDDFRRLALSLEGAVEGAHLGAADFRVGGRIFATLAHADQGLGNLMLTAEQQSQLVAEAPDVFLPIAGGWGRMGATHVRLQEADELLLRGALQMAWKQRVEKNNQGRPAKSAKRANAVKKRASTKQPPSEGGPAKRRKHS